MYYQKRQPAMKITKMILILTLNCGSPRCSPDSPIWWSSTIFADICQSSAIFAALPILAAVIVRFEVKELFFKIYKISSTTLCFFENIFDLFWFPTLLIIKLIEILQTPFTNSQIVIHQKLRKSHLISQTSVIYCKSN